VRRCGAVNAQGGERPALQPRSFAHPETCSHPPTNRRSTHSPGKPRRKAVELGAVWPSETAPFNLCSSSRGCPLATARHGGRLAAPAARPRRRRPSGSGAPRARWARSERARGRGLSWTWMTTAAASVAGARCVRGPLPGLRAAHKLLHCCCTLAQFDKATLRPPWLSLSHRKLPAICGT